MCRCRASSVRRATLALGPEFAARPGDGFFDAADALNRREPPLVSDLVREAAMASALAALMAQHVSVLWVGGFAHWARIVERLRCRDFAAPDTVPAPRRRFTRARLGPSALMRLTGLYPSMVAAFARAPQEFDPFDAMRLLLQEAAKPEPDGQETPPVGEARTMLPSEPAAAIDLARTGLYARNLAATARISEQPQLAELVLAASATIGPRYAARLFELATAEHLSTPGRALDALTFEVDPHTRGSDQVEAGFCFRGRRLSAEPWFPVPWPILDPPDVAQLTREARDADYEGLPDARHRGSVPLARVSAGPGRLRRIRPVRAAPSQSERPRRRSVAAVREWTRGRAGCADDHSVLARGPDLRPPAPTDVGHPSGTV